MVEVPISKADVSEQFRYNEAGEKYFLAYENSHRRVSILFSDLTWLRKHFGVDRNEGSPITKESLNEGRNNEIAMYEMGLKYKTPLWELGKVDMETGKPKINPDTDEPYKTFYRLSDAGKELFQKKIDEGQLILCMYKD